jgi:hypothetical protein
MPSFIAEMFNWDFSIHPTDSDFVFQPPEGATQVELKPAAATTTAPTIAVRWGRAPCTVRMAARRIAPTVTPYRGGAYYGGGNRAYLPPAYYRPPGGGRPLRAGIIPIRVVTSRIVALTGRSSGS